MPHYNEAVVQLGKNGLSDNFFETLNSCFKNHMTVRVYVLKSAGHEREKVKEFGEKIIEKLGSHYTFKKIGFTLIVRKWRKARG